MIGATIGTTTKVISIKSKKKPSKNIDIITISIALKVPPGRLVRKYSIVSSPPKPLKTRLKSVAPINIIKTIEVILVDDLAASIKTPLKYNLYILKSVEIKKITKIVTAKNIKKDTKIIDYKAKIITVKETQTNPKYDNDKAIYLYK